MALERSDEIYFTWKAIKLGFTAGCSSAVYLKINHSLLTNFDLEKARISLRVSIIAREERELVLIWIIRFLYLSGGLSRIAENCSSRHSCHHQHPTFWLAINDMQTRYSINWGSSLGNRSLVEFTSSLDSKISRSPAEIQIHSCISLFAFTHSFVITAV